MRGQQVAEPAFHRAVEPLEPGAGWLTEEAPETYPSRRVSSN